MSSHAVSTQVLASSLIQGELTQAYVGGWRQVQSADIGGGWVLI